MAGQPAVGRDWILKVQEALHETNTKYPFLAYGTDWLPLGIFVIAIAFVGALRDPVRQHLAVHFGMIACILVVPYALLLRALRGFPLGWRSSTVLRCGWVHSL